VDDILKPSPETADTEPKPEPSRKKKKESVKVPEKTPALKAAPPDEPDDEQPEPAKKMEADPERAKLEKELFDEIERATPPAGKEEKPSTAAKGADPTAEVEGDEPEVSKAIQDAVIQERLKKLTEEITADERKGSKRE
jgi:hypothetical protein